MNQPTPPLLARTRLVQRIVATLKAHNIVIAAPAGYGKSTLLRSLVAQLPRSTYMALSPADADSEMLRARLTPILNQAVVILLDDVHHLADAAQTLAWLAEIRRSTNARWVLGGHAIPPQLIDPSDARMGAEQLAFGLGECKALLANHSEADAAAWHARTSGWPLALAMLAQQAMPQALLVGANTQAELFAYLVQSVIAQLPSEVSHGLTCMALPLRFNDALLATLMDASPAHATKLRGEVQQRSLFIENAHAPGWFKLHDPMRQYLRSQLAPRQREAVAQQLCDWFEAADDPRMVIEHALEDGLHDRAAEYIDQRSNRLLFDLAWHQSYKRWLSLLPSHIHAHNPALYSRLGFALIYHHQPREEGWRYLDLARALALKPADPEIRAEVERNVAAAHSRMGESEQALAILRQISLLEGLSPVIQFLIHLSLGNSYAFLYRLSEATHAYQISLELAERLEPPEARANKQESVRHNLATMVAAPRGDLKTQHELLSQNLAQQFQHNEPSRLELTYVGFATLHEIVGDWPALMCDLQHFRDIRVQSAEDANLAHAEYQMEVQWEMWYWAAYYIGTSDFASAEPLVKSFVGNVTEPEPIAAGQWLQAWLLRRQANHQACIAFADNLPTEFEAPALFYRAATAFERAASALCAGLPDWDRGIEPHMRFHLRARAKHFLLRWRVLLVLACYRAKSGWRKHIAFALASIRRNGYERLLIQREPELAAQFWALCLAEGIEPAQAQAALRELKIIAPIMGLIRDHLNTHSAVPLIRALADTEREEAIPFLAELLEQRLDNATANSVRAALSTLEASQPPHLAVMLLGAFSVKRGGTFIQDNLWQRPMVRQLLIYFCLHHRQRIRRHQLLQDLWPQNDAASALNAYRTTLSRLSEVLEPHLRLRTPMRYLEIGRDGETICFDPTGTLVILDSEKFASAVAQRDELQLDVLLQTLSAWQPPIPALRSAAWAIEFVETLNERYAAGCLFAAQHLLQVGDNDNATAWAERVINTTPWNEMGWQAYITATARQGQRTQALKLYGRAVAVLNDELAVAPSPQTVALGERLRSGEAI